MDESLRAEASALIAAARSCVEDLLEEGVEGIDRDPAAVTEALAADRIAPQTAEPAAGGEEGGARLPPKERAKEARPSAPVPVGLAGIATPFDVRPTLEAVRGELGECTRCGLCEGRSTIVFGDGNPEAELMFVGEGPGEQEDRAGLPFVGRAGELLTQMIEKGLGIPRSDVYICNIVKCRPPNNRNPLPGEVAACKPFLDGQIDAIRPKVIVALGKPATSLLLGREIAITRVRGSWQEYRGIPVMPTFHPAFILRQYTPENRRNVWQDLQHALSRARGEG